MRKSTKAIFVLLVVTFVVVWQSVVPKITQPAYIADTGHRIADVFLEYYYAHPDPRLVFGLPITGEFQDPYTDQLVQYFQNVRMEYIQVAPPGQQVQLAPLGLSLVQSGDFIPALTGSSPGCSQKANWNFPVCFDFLSFYQSHGGEEVFGAPVSNLQRLNGKVVQFFQYAQMVWNPDNPREASIVLEPLGLKEFHASGLHPALLEPNVNYINYPANVSDIELSQLDTREETQRPAYIPETGHRIAEVFLEYYYANPDPRLIYGLPITDELHDPHTGQLIQYFQNVRMEFFPGNSPGQQVWLAPLGLKLLGTGEYIPELTGSSPGCSQEGDWDYPICYDFLQFYQQYGGVTQFGRPVSNLQRLNGRVIQFFEFAQMVWMPENEENSIVLEPLGQKDFHASGLDPALLNPNVNTISYRLSIREIKLTAFTGNAVLENGGVQQINAIAYDQNNIPLSNGIVTVTLIYPDGSIQRLEPATTDNEGKVAFINTCTSSIPGRVEVVVTVQFNGLQAIAKTSFRLCC